jgi:hypothetical protein
MSTYDRADKSRRGGIVVTVVDSGRPVDNASISLFRAPEGLERGKFSAKTWKPEPGDLVKRQQTELLGGQAATRFGNVDATRPWYIVRYDNEPETNAQPVDVQPACDTHICIDIPLGFEMETRVVDDNYQDAKSAVPQAGQRVVFIPKFTKLAAPPPGLMVIAPTQAIASPNQDSFAVVAGPGPNEFVFHVGLPMRSGLPGGGVTSPSASDAARVSTVVNFIGAPANVQAVGGSLGVSLQRTATPLTADVSHWQAILNITDAMSFNQYFRFMERMFCGDRDTSGLFQFEQNRFDTKDRTARDLLSRRALPFVDTDAYRLVKVATEAFVMVNCGIMSQARPFVDSRDSGYFARRDVPFPTNGLELLFTNDYLTRFPGGGGALTLPYLAVIRKKLGDVDINSRPFEFSNDEVSECYGILQEKLVNPCLLELIWSYWQEEGMLVQTVNAITRRFQNVRGSSPRDPLANLEIDPLRPLSNLLWGWVQDEQHRLTVVRRNYEYDHHYGFRLEGRVVQGMNPADTRSKFLEAFHNLLRLCTIFFKQDDDTTIKADAFPVLNALKEVHLILTEGQHNQFGDLTSTARVEMMMQQWLLARPEFREFLPTRISVALPEPWMDRVDAMKKLQGWTDTSVLQFRNLAIFGEQILLGIRWGFWSDVQEAEQAFNWARIFRPQIQGYIHAYRAVAGVDLSADISDTQVDATMPSTLLRRRLTAQQQRGA